MALSERTFIFMKCFQENAGKRSERRISKRGRCSEVP